jgi:[ribosomal protein S18]-alanine N-acetyltransferase
VVTPVRLERMRWWHVAALLPLEREVFGEQPWSERAFWSELGQLDTRHYVVALDGDRSLDVVGYAGLCDYPDQAWVQTMAVAPGHRGRGLGGRLLDALLSEAARRRQRVVSLEVRAGNAAAQRLYERHGFVRTGVRRGYYEPSGEDAVLMTRRG